MTAKGRFRALFSVAALGLSAGLAQAATVTLTNPQATYSQSGFNVAAAIDGSMVNNTGWAISSSIVSQSATFDAVDPVVNPAGTLFTFTLSQLFPSPDMHTIGKFKISVTSDNSTWNDLTGVTFAANPAELPASIAGDGTILLNGSYRPSTSVYTVTGKTNLPKVTGFKLDVMEDATLPHNGPGRQPTNGNFVLTEFQVDATPIPLPSAAWAGMALMGGLGVARRLRRRA